MIGINTITLNQSTLKDAVQHYFDTILFAPGHSPTVVAVKTASITYSGALTVDVETESPEKAEEAQP